ncbi:MAG: S41 family peptidase [Sneathiella sp.]|nr:S41 family peptidase [Sneathiella sp.]
MLKKSLIFAVSFLLLTACALPFTMDRAIESALDRYEQAYIATLENTENLSEDRETMESALKRIKNRYVDEVNLDDLVGEAIKGLQNKENTEQPATSRAMNKMLASLDPYSGYMDPASYARYQQNLDGRFVGFGFRIEMRNKKLTVIAPLKGSSAEEAGILPNDIITHLDGEPLAKYSFPDAIAKLRGPQGSRAVLTILRPDVDTPIKLGLVRRALDLVSVEYKVDGDVGYIRIHSFNRKTGDSVEEALNHFDEKLGGNLCGVILDMRNNPGGLVTAAVRVADQFLNTGNIFSAMNRGKSFSDEDAKKGDRLNGRPILIMLNNGSASSAEIVAGALQFQKRARVFGQQSYGKGTMQTLYDLDNGGGMRLTTGRFTAGGGVSFNGSGLTPDILDTVKKGENALAPVARAGEALNCTVSVQTAAADLTS